MTKGSTKAHHVVVAVGGFPPPVTGAAKNLEIICRDIETLNPNLVRINVARGRIGYRWRMLPRRIWRYVRAWAALARQAGHRRKTLYLTSDGGPGLAFTLLTVLIGRIFNYRVVLQHRTFQYTRDRNRLAAAVNRAIGTSGLHVFLSDGMAVNYFDQYQTQRPYVVNHDLAQMNNFRDQVRNNHHKMSRPEFVIGYLSNLMLEKGFDTFLEVARLSVNESLPCTFILAGPTPGPAEEAMVRNALADLDPMVEWRGAVHGEAKIRFYQDIDLFLFPTRYLYETQPNVVLEALCAGVHVIASDLGLINEDISPLNGSVVSKENIDNASHWLDATKLVMELKACDPTCGSEKALSEIDEAITKHRLQYWSLLRTVFAE